MFKKLNIKKWYKIILTQEGEQKYHLNFLAFGSLPLNDIITWSTVLTKAGDRFIVKHVKCNVKQLRIIKEVMGDYIVAITELT